MYKYMILLSILCATIFEVQAQPATVMSGGVGEEAMRALLPQQSAYNLKLVLTLREGDYIAGVAVKITNAAGSTVVEHTTEGPILLARLPAGKYTATLTYEGVTQTRTFTLRANGLHIEQARWTRSAADGEPLL